jgi:hypothetical protein
MNAKALLVEENLRHGAELSRALLEVLGECPFRLMPFPRLRFISALGLARGASRETRSPDLTPQGGLRGKAQIS